jgi:uncharacterized protein with von Willebrand factor type A (vWA) domain
VKSFPSGFCSGPLSSGAGESVDGRLIGSGSETTGAVAAFFFRLTINTATRIAATATTAITTI